MIYIVAWIIVTHGDVIKYQTAYLKQYKCVPHYIILDPVKTWVGSHKILIQCYNALPKVLSISKAVCNGGDITATVPLWPHISSAPWFVQFPFLSHDPLYGVCYRRLRWRFFFLHQQLCTVGWQFLSYYNNEFVGGPICFVLTIVVISLRQLRLFWWAVIYSDI